MQPIQTQHAELTGQIEAVTARIQLWQNQRVERAEHLTSEICQKNNPGVIEFAIQVLRQAQDELNVLYIKLEALEKQLALTGVCATCGRSD